VRGSIPISLLFFAGCAHLSHFAPKLVPTVELDAQYQQLQNEGYRQGAGSIWIVASWQSLLGRSHPGVLMPPEWMTDGIDFSPVEFPEDDPLLFAPEEEFFSDEYVTP